MNSIRRLPIALCAVLIGAILVFVPVLTATAKTYGNLYNAIYVGTHDGRTIIFDIAGVHPLIGEKIEVRLRGVGLPDIAGRCRKESELAKQARDIVRWLCQNAKTIILQDVGRDKLFRLTAIVLVDGKDIRNVLIRKGLAVPQNASQPERDWCK